jgi:hypothetical protein
VSSALSLRWFLVVRGEPVVEALRTPDDQFRGLPGWDHSPSYVEDLPGDD